VIVVAHNVPDGCPREGAAVSFVTDGIESAMQQAETSPVIALATPSIIQQCLNLGLVDRIHVKVVRLPLGAGVRMLGALTSGPKSGSHG
jgi:dihydrofolate reductase